MALLLVILHKSGSTSHVFLNVLAVGGAVFSSIYASFAIQRNDLDGTSLSLRDRVAYMVSAIAYFVLFCRFGFPEVFLGSAWIYVGASLSLFLIVSPMVGAKTRSEQGGELKSDHAPS